MSRTERMRPSDRMADAACDLATRIRAGVLVCTDPEQTADLLRLAEQIAAWAEEVDGIEELAISTIIRNGGALASRRAA